MSVHVTIEKGIPLPACKAEGGLRRTLVEMNATEKDSFLIDPKHRAAVRSAAWCAKIAIYMAPEGNKLRVWKTGIRR